MKSLSILLLLLAVSFSCFATGWICCTEKYIRSSFRAGTVETTYNSGLRILRQEDEFQKLSFFIDEKSMTCYSSILVPKMKSVLNFLIENFNQKGTIVVPNSEWRFYEAHCNVGVILQYDPQDGQEFVFALVN